MSVKRPWAVATAAILFAGCMADPLGAPRRIDLFDSARNRSVPVLIVGEGRDPRPLAVISHGYGTPADAYRFLSSLLVERGFVVAAVQHDLPGDPPPATTGNLAVARRPGWETGAANIDYVARILRARGVASMDPLVLVGHSQGGDISMVFAEMHADDTRLVFSLDNRRMPMPRTSQIRICSIRSVNLPADPGVLPGPDEQLAFGVRVYRSQVRHEDMTDAGSRAARQEILDAFGDCLDALPSPPG